MASKYTPKPDRKTYEPRGCANPDVWVDPATQHRYLRGEGNIIYVILSESCEMHYCCSCKKQLCKLTDRQREPKRLIAD